MQGINIDNYKPYKKMGQTCETREISEKKIIWPYFEREIYDGSYKIRMLKESEVDEIAELWRISYPELYGSSNRYEWVLYPQKYNRKIAFQETWEQESSAKQCMSVLEDLNTGNIINASLFTKDDRNLHVEYSLGCIHPDYREGGKGDSLVVVAFEYLKAIEDNTDTEYMTSFCETWHSITQYLCFKQWGWKIAGIFPGQVTRWNGDNLEYRGCTVHFYKFLGDAEKFATKPEEWKLIPEVNKVWDILEEINCHSSDTKMREYLNENY
jgi:hypothetical protein